MFSPTTPQGRSLPLLTDLSRCRTAPPRANVVTAEHCRRHGQDETCQREYLCRPPRRDQKFWKQGQRTNADRMGDFRFSCHTTRDDAAQEREDAAQEEIHEKHRCAEDRGDSLRRRLPLAHKTKAHDQRDGGRGHECAAPRNEPPQEDRPRPTASPLNDHLISPRPSSLIWPCAGTVLRNSQGTQTTGTDPGREPTGLAGPTAAPPSLRQPRPPRSVQHERRDQVVVKFNKGQVQLFWVAFP